MASKGMPDTEQYKPGVAGGAGSSGQGGIGGRLPGQGSPGSGGKVPGSPGKVGGGKPGPNENPYPGNTIANTKPLPGPPGSGGAQPRPGGILPATPFSSHPGHGSAGKTARDFKV